MLKSWESDGQQVIEATERRHYTPRGVARRIRKLQAQGKYGHGENLGGGYVVSVEQIPGSWDMTWNAPACTE